MKVAAATALGAAAVKAKMMADAEEREVRHQVQLAVEAQLQKVQLKLDSMTQLEDALEKERSIMEVGAPLSPLSSTHCSVMMLVKHPLLLNLWVLMLSAAAAFGASVVPLSDRMLSDGFVWLIAGSVLHVSCSIVLHQASTVTRLAHCSLQLVEQ